MDGSLSPQWATAEPTLQIPSVGFEDEGTYECEAENTKGRDTVQGRIIVQGTAGRRPRPRLPSRSREAALELQSARNALRRFKSLKVTGRGNVDIATMYWSHD